MFSESRKWLSYKSIIREVHKQGRTGVELNFEQALTPSLCEQQSCRTGFCACFGGFCGLSIGHSDGVKCHLHSHILLNLR